MRRLKRLRRAANPMPAGSATSLLDPRDRVDQADHLGGPRPLLARRPGRPGSSDPLKSSTTSLDLVVELTG